MARKPKPTLDTLIQRINWEAGTLFGDTYGYDPNLTRAALTILNTTAMHLHGALRHASPVVAPSLDDVRTLLTFQFAGLRELRAAHHGLARGLRDHPAFADVPVEVTDQIEAALEQVTAGFGTALAGLGNADALLATVTS
ncbi:hypothetical protein [Longispora albida]|uniref:hypothetical protein n=1 Tax=Longispora albida TaxID=203523 RepID=UPI000361891E|nr:hypothetical protein [Longispora albida]